MKTCAKEITYKKIERERVGKREREKFELGVERKDKESKKREKNVYGAH